MYAGRFSMQQRQPKSNSGFSGATFDPNTGLRTAASGSIAEPTTSSEASAPQQPTLLGRLYLLRPESPELKERLSALLEKLGPLWSEAEELEALIVKEQRQALEAQYQQIRKKGRELDRQYKQLSRELQAAEEAVMNAGLRKESLVEAVQNLALLEQRGQHVSRWADDKELAEWNQRVEQAKSLVPPANQLFAEAVMVRNEVMSKFEQAKAQLEKIGAEEIRLRKRLAGEAFVDPELGLTVSS
jgi:chromosome segregation ATPase